MDHRTTDFFEEWMMDEMAVATQVLKLKAGDAYYCMEDLDEKTAEYLIEKMMERKWIGATMVMYLDEDDMEEDYYRNEKHPVFGYCRNLDNGMNIIGLYKHDLLVLAHEMTHAMINFKGIKQTSAHDEVFWVLHRLMLDELMALCGRD